MGSGTGGTGGDKTFAAKVSVKIDEASLASAGRAIQDALKKATEGIDLKAFRDIAEAAKILAAQTDNIAKAEAARSTAKRGLVDLAKAEQRAIESQVNAETQMVLLEQKAAAGARERQQVADALALAQREYTALIQQQAPLEKDLQAKLEAQLAAERESLKLVAVTIDEKKRLAAINKAEEEEAKQQARAEKEIAALTDKQLSSQALILQTQIALAAAQERLNEAKAQQLPLETDLLKKLEAQLVAERASLKLTPLGTTANLGTLGGALSNNFFTTLLSGGGLSSALGQSLGQLQPALFQIAQGGQQATAAFSALGVQGVGAVSALTTNVAGLGAGLLTVLPLIAEAGGRLVGFLSDANESQKEFIFQSGILAKQLGTTAEEGAQLRALLTAVGQEDNIFAAITLNQIQASVAALDRVNKGLETASPQIEKFGQALTQLGVDYKKQNGDLKTFAELVVDISAGIGKLDTAQRSLAVQNLAGLFGSDVAKLFGLGPEGLTSILQNAVVVTKEQQKANDDLQISLTNLTSAQAEFNIALAGSITPFETFVNTIKSGALREGASILEDIFGRISGVDFDTAGARDTGEKLGMALVEGIGQAVLGAGGIGALDFFLPSREQLNQKAAQLRSDIAAIEAELKLDPESTTLIQTLEAYQDALAEIEKRLDAISPKLDAVLGGKVAGVGPSLAADKKNLADLEKALDTVDAANKDLVEIQKAVIKSNEDVAKSFRSQIDAIQKAAGAYDTFYEKVGQSSTKIAEIQSGVGKTFTQIGTGTVKDVEKAILDLRVLEERLGKAGSPGDPRYDQLALNIRRRRQALGLQPGELTDIANVDVTVGITGLSKKQIEELNAEFAKLVELKREFLQGGFDVAQTSFDALLSTLTDLPVEQFGDVLTGGASALQKYAESLGLFASPGFSQAIGEAALKTKLLAGGFGEINTAAGAEAAFAKYLEAFKGFREDLFDLSEFIANPQKLTVPLALDFGLITQTDVTLVEQAKNANAAVKDALLEGGAGFGSEIDEQARAALTGGAQQKLGQLGEGGGIVNLLLAKYGITPGKAIEATAEFAIDAEADLTLAQKEIDKQFEKLKAEEEAKNRALTLNIEVDAIFNTDAIRKRIQEVLDAITPGGVVTTPGDNNGLTPIGGGRAAGGDVFRGMAYPVGEEGKPEFFIPRSDGRIIPGNETASLMRLMAGNERMPAQPIVNYSPVVQQYLTVDARGTNARDVTSAIQRTQAKQSLFTSSSALVRDRDFLRSHGIR